MATKGEQKKLDSRIGKSSNPVSAWIWRSYIWVAGSFSLGMMEVWEQLLVCELESNC